MMRSSRATATALEIRTWTILFIKKKKKSSEVVGLIYFLKSKGHNSIWGRALLDADGA